MGTLFNQPPRFGYDEHGRDVSLSVENVANDIASMALRINHEYGISFEESLKCIKLSLQIQNSDVKDEQLAGFGELLRSLIDVLEQQILGGDTKWLTK